MAAVRTVKKGDRDIRHLLRWALGFRAQRPQAQADFLQGLLSCNDLPELLQRQSEFCSCTWAAYAGGLSQVLGHCNSAGRSTGERS
jgi:hypothetical protein